MSPLLLLVLGGLVAVAASQPASPRAKPKPSGGAGGGVPDLTPEQLRALGLGRVDLLTPEQLRALGKSASGRATPEELRALGLGPVELIQL